MYAIMQAVIRRPVLYFEVSLPNIIANGNATSCVTSRARSRPVELSPSAEP